jgi:competence protein ComEC
MVLGLFVSVGASCLEPKTDDCRLTVLNVGQGQSLIYQSDGKTYLVDCGGDYDDDAADLAAETLLSQGIRSIDGLIITHFDRDHVGGVLNFLSRIDVDEILIPDYVDDGDFRESLETLAPERITPVSEDMQISFEGTTVNLFAPVVPDDNNESSLAVLFRKDNCDILITGDRSAFGERLLLKNGDIPQLDVLVAGHHGSKTATCRELLESTTPRIVAISVGENSYGHPSTEVLDRLTEFGCIVYRSDYHGNITFRR